MLFLYIISADSGGGGVKCWGVKVAEVYLMWLRGEERKREEGSVEEKKIGQVKEDQWSEEVRKRQNCQEVSLLIDFVE